MALVFLVWLLSKLRKASKKPASNPVDASWLNPNANYQAFVDRLSNAIEGFGMFNMDEKANALRYWLTDLNDQEFIYCVNLYNSQFGAPTLRERITKEEWLFGPGAGTAKDRFISRMDRLQVA